MLLNYLDDILEDIKIIRKTRVTTKQYYFIEAVYYYNNSIADSLCKIKDEYIANQSPYSEISMRLLLNEMDQLRREFIFFEKKKPEDKNFPLFIKKISHIMLEIEKCNEKLGLDIKITYSFENYYNFEELLEKVENDLPVEPDFSIDQVDKGSQKSEINLIAHKFWSDNFGAKQHVNYDQFFQTFKIYVFETEKTNIDEKYYAELRNHLDISFNLKVFLKHWDSFFSNLWSDYYFRKDFLVYTHGSIPYSSDLKNLTLEYYHGSEKKKTYTITGKDIVKKPVIFGRKSDSPEYTFTDDIIVSNFQFQIVAYNTMKEIEGYYISNLSFNNETSLSVDEKGYILDKGTIFEIKSQSYTVYKLLPRPKFESLDENKYFYVPTSLPDSQEDLSLIEKNSITIGTSDGSDTEFEEKSAEAHEKIGFVLKGDSVAIISNPNENTLLDLVALIEFKEGKWVLKRVDKQREIVLVCLSSDNDYKNEVSYGTKLKNGMKILCKGSLMTAKKEIEIDYERSHTFIVSNG